MIKHLRISLLMVLLPCLAMAQVQEFKTNNTNGNLLDACGNNFVMKGMNVATAWFVSSVNNSVAAVKTNTRSNCLRIVVSETSADADWQTTVVNCIKNRMIPMVELHSVTGNTDPARLRAMGEFWARKASFINSTNFQGVNIRRHILVNLANEWGTWQTATNKNTVWRDAVIAAIRPMRTAGITTTIVVDAVGYGQDIDEAWNLRTYGKDIQRADNTNLGGPANSTANANILFSIHMYCEWKKGGDNIGIINTIKGMGMPVIVGEFGYQHATDGSCDIDEQSILNTCQAGGIGWLAWSQKGNGSSVAYLDLCIDWNCTQLSNWGNTIINGTNGTKTAIEASVFSSTSCSANPPTPTPTATITAPTNACAGTAINLTSAASVSSGSISKVDFYNGATLLGTDNSAPYSYTYANAPVGSHTIRAIATSAAGTASTPATSTVNVVANPTVSISSPTNNATVTSNPASVTINVATTGTGISSVQFFNGTTSLGTDASAPYSYTWANVANGTYSLTARVTNAQSCSTTSAPVSVTVNRLTSVDDMGMVNSTKLYPNPFHSNFTINTPGAFNYTVSNIIGHEVLNGTGVDNTTTGQNLPTGVYLVTVTNASGNKTFKVTKE